MIPNVAHFVFGLRNQEEPFHPLHYVAIESCRRVLAPERIYFHHGQLPFGPYWERIAPHLTLCQVDLSAEVLEADYSSERVPEGLRYAHHADFVRLDALIEHGGVYADIDTVFLRPFPRWLFEQRFVIGRESAVQDEVSGVIRPSLCNALLMAEPGAAFARTWRERMAAAINGTWSNHSGFLSERLSREIPDAVSVVPQTLFFPFDFDRPGLRRLLEESHPFPPESVSVHLWAHLWWDRRRREMSRVHSAWCTPEVLRHVHTTLAEAALPYLGQNAPTRDDRPALSERPGANWRYLSLDEDSGYGIAADRCRNALGEAEVQVDWFPFIPGQSWGLGYEPAFPLPSPLRSEPFGSRPGVTIAHLVPEYLPKVRAALPHDFLVVHTVWETDRLPRHWPRCLEYADLIVVPSRFAAAAVEREGLTTPTEVVPHVAVDPASPWTDRWLDVEEDRFVFYTISEWNQRKAVFLTIEAYLRAFRSSDPVVLVVKTSAVDHCHGASPRTRFGPGTTAYAVAQLVARHPDPPPLRIVTRQLTNGEIAGLHHRGNCYLSLCRSEGWGLGAFDAAASGNPIVTTNFGGHLDYLDGSPLLVDFDLVPVIQGTDSSYTGEQRWAEPHLDQATALCRDVVADPGPIRRLAQERAERVRIDYRPAQVGAHFRSAVERHRHRRAG